MHHAVRCFCSFLVPRKGPHHIHGLRSRCFTKQSAFNVAGNLVIVVKFTFQIAFGNSSQNPRHATARGHDESLELHSILWSKWRTSKQKVLRHGNRFVARVRRPLFLGGRETTTGNTSAVRRLALWKRPYFMSLICFVLLTDLSNFHAK